MTYLDTLLDQIPDDVTAGEQRVQAVVELLRNAESDVDLAELETGTASTVTTAADEADSDDDVTRLETLVDVLDAVRSVQQEQQQAQADRDSKVAELRSRAAPPEPTDSAEDSDGDAESGADADEPPSDTGDSDQPDQAESGESATDAGGATQDEDQSAAHTSTDDTSESAPQPVAASASSAPRRQSTASALNAAGQTMNAPAPKTNTVNPLRRYSITASAEVPDMPYGKSLTMDELAEAALARYATFPEGQPTNGAMKANVARINREWNPDYTLTGNDSDRAIIDSIADETRLPGGSLVAAAGKALTAADQAPSVINDVWCSPSETDWTLCPPLATTDGMIDLPTTGMPRRGGLRYPVWLQYPEQAAETGTDAAPFHGTVVEYPDTPAGTGLDNPDYFTTSGNEKRCISGPCVEWAEVRQSIEYLCITSDILRDKTFPELTQRFISDVLVHHQHNMNSIYLQHILRKSDPIPAYSVQNGAGSIGSSSLVVTDRLALLVSWFRNTYRMSRNATLELVAPDWFRDYLKRDLEKKQNRPYGSVSDAEVTAIFASYSTRVQWVQDWQDLPSSGTAGGFSGGLMPPDSWPTSVNIMAFPAGSWVLFKGNILSLGVQYDYTLLSQNRYSAMFSEDAWMMLNRCNRSFVVQLTELCANGAIGPNRDACAPAAPAV